MLTKVQFMVDDKDVGAVLRAVAETSAVYDLSAVPVINAKPKATKGKGKGKKVEAETDGDTGSLLVNHLRAIGLIKFRFRDVSGFCKTIGLTPGAASSLLYRLIDQNQVKKTGHGQYELVHQESD